MNYLIDLGYRRQKLIFSTLSQANKLANDIMKQTREVLAVTSTEKLPTHNYTETDEGFILQRIKFPVIVWENSNCSGKTYGIFSNRKSAINCARKIADKYQMITVREEDVVVDMEKCVIATSTPILEYTKGEE